MSIAVVKDIQEEVVALATTMSTHTSNKIGTIDLMQCDSRRALSGSMNSLFLHLFAYMKEGHIQRFSSGVAPLSSVETSRKGLLQERIAYLIYEFGSHSYSFHGLREYKSEYATNWVLRYTLYFRGSWIAYVMTASLTIDNVPVEQTQDRISGLKKWMQRRY